MGEGMKNNESFSSDSDDSILSTSSELTEEEDDTASTTIGPNFELSSLMDQLPIKRGLSKYYQGKSQSFTSLSNVRYLEDLPKKETPYQKKKMKPSKSYGGGLDLGQKPLNYSLGPCSKAYINKKSGLRRSSNNLLFCNKPPHPTPHASLHKNL
ncbi:uncharacterized protein LOC120280806 [Dioscorea cayenensis subsp. rotundata]|uniref:Uncharacterized protein LOC120280806 n=1 Tax=Dioscorea cayennensis subsp. rotundata TaxID=55577 RepID=A0AB40CWV1_DIOCR|nr:uncharacterized protein LOC120280806 [Dioscorea cayenensis subsp. rotundata]